MAITALQEQLYLLAHYVFSQFITLGLAITVLFKSKEKDKTPYGEEEGRLRRSIFNTRMMLEVASYSTETKYSGYVTLGMPQ